MINQELINKTESDIKANESICSKQASEILNGYKQVIEDNAQLFRELSYLRMKLDKIAKTDPGGSGELARLALAPYGGAE